MANSSRPPHASSGTSLPAPPPANPPSSAPPRGNNNNSREREHRRGHGHQGWPTTFNPMMGTFQVWLGYAPGVLGARPRAPSPPPAGSHRPRLHRAGCPWRVARVCTTRLRRSRSSAAHAARPLRRTCAGLLRVDPIPPNHVLGSAGAGQRLQHHDPHASGVGRGLWSRRPHDIIPW